MQADVTGALASEARSYPLSRNEYAGKTVLLDIGITKEGFHQQLPRYRQLLAASFPCFNKRSGRKTKASSKACLCARQPEYGGSRVPFGRAAALMGTGLVRVVSEACNREILQTLLRKLC